MKVYILDCSQLEIGDQISFSKYSYRNAAGGTSSVVASEPVSGVITKMWEDYECGFRFHAELSDGTTAYVSEFEITG